MIQQLKEDRQKMLEENSRLQAVNTQLQLDNASLQQENTELKTKLGMGTIHSSSTDIQLHLDLPPPPPPPSPCYPQHQYPPPHRAPHSNLLSQQHSLMSLSSRSKVAVCHTKPPGCRRKA